MATMQQIIDAARRPLNDADKTTWSDAELLAYALDGMRRLRGERPDLFFGLAGGLIDTLAGGSTFPLDEFVQPALTDYITARAQFKDDEYAVQGAAAPFFALFKEALA